MIIATDKAYIATENISIIVEEGKTKGECCIIKIKHTFESKQMSGEVVFAPGDLPDLIEALTRATLHAYLRDNYLSGYTDGRKSSQNLAFNALDKYYETEEGENQLKKDVQKRTLSS